MGQTDIKKDKIFSIKFSIKRLEETLARSVRRWKGKKLPDDIADERERMRTKLWSFKKQLEELED